MLRQLSNFVQTGRFRTVAATPRSRKPWLLKYQPELEIDNLLEYVVAQHAPRDKPFYFVQIGAFDGREGDHLYQMIRQRGWHGVLVEPQPDAFKALKRNYQGQPHLQFFNVAIGPQSGSLTLYTRRTGGVPIASVSKRLLIKPGHSRDEVVAIDVPCLTFDELLEQAGSPRRIDLLQIDTEGFDFEIIRSIRFDRVRPRIIRFEHALLSKGDRSRCLSMLAGEGYRFLLEDRDTMAIHRSANAMQAAA